MLNIRDIMETVTMIQEENLDIRTITMGLSLLDCADSDIDRSAQKVYNKITRQAEKLVATGEEIEQDKFDRSNIAFLDSKNANYRQMALFFAGRVS